MNRRTFLSTLTALLGVVLAKIKAPSGPKFVAGVDPAFGLDETAIHVQRFNVPVLTSFAPKGVTSPPGSAGYSLNLGRFITPDEAKAMIRLDNP